MTRVSRAVKSSPEHKDNMIVMMHPSAAPPPPHGWLRPGPVGQEALYSLKSDGCRHKGESEVLCAAGGGKVLCSWITHTRGWQV